MSAPSSPLPRVTEVVTNISDQNMGFRSLQPPVDANEIPASRGHSKGIVKRTKNRKSTPLPIMKGGGRKRFSFSHSSELKQDFKKSAHNDSVEGRGRELRKRRNLLSDLSEVADVVNVPLLPEVRSKDMELEGDESLNEMNQERRMLATMLPPNLKTRRSPAMLPATWRTLAVQRTTSCTSSGQSKMVPPMLMVH